ncbi:MAG TPA: D-alanyl-D-alanine carboxypeptidase/D-alanyl-D-alanine-endopeptidase [Draconibacterium sp.]|nr:D-alanyl-D-alanine carboxypeptidase/D-alanyl-D-alanine-endopeptidase [Draconibacterium sp.]
MNLRIFTLLIAILAGQCVLSQQKFDVALQKVLQQADYQNVGFGIHIRNLSTGETIYNINGNKRMIPASTLKIITSGAALEILGPEYRFTTLVGFSGKIKNNTLTGDLVVVGGGDPALGSEYFMDNYFNPDFLDVWAQKLKAAGISKVEGNLVLDGSLYDSEKIPPTWIWEDMGNYYGAGTSALTVFDNLFRITFSSPARAGRRTKIISINPEIRGLKIRNEVLSSDLNRDEAYVFGSPLDKIRKITGTIPANRRAFTIKASVQHPEELLAEVFLTHLAKAGIFITGAVKFEKVKPGKFQVLYIQESPELKDIVKVLNHKSVNLFAEHLVKQLAAEKNGLGTREAGIEIIKDFWNSKGIDTDNIFMEDGSGLSHFDAVAPEQFTKILDYMYNRSENKEVFLESLPKPGDGTLHGFESSLFPENTLRAKSGSMTRVRCYAGYLKLDTGQIVAFSIMVNQFGGSHSKLILQVQFLLNEIKKSF